MQRQLTLEQERQLVELAQNDPVNFSALYQAYIERVYGYVFCRLNSRQDTEDLVSEIFIKTLRSIRQYNEKQGSFSAWIFSIVRNATIDFLRKSQTETIPIETISNLPSANILPEESITNAERSQYIRNLISDLSERRQEVITLRYFAGLRNKEIAEVLKLDERTVASHLSRALEDLKVFLMKEAQNDAS